jgi:hypothetical protein
MGYDQASKVEWVIVAGFSLAQSATIFSIVDLDRPRSRTYKPWTDRPGRIVELRKMLRSDRRYRV